jgi:predicted lipid-binding transport protein (Tim44 family)/uncharacterized Zn finger protein (UPF0148 family)
MNSIKKLFFNRFSLFGSYIFLGLIDIVDARAGGAGRSSHSSSSYSSGSSDGGAGLYFLFRFLFFTKNSSILIVVIKLFIIVVIINIAYNYLKNSKNEKNGQINRYTDYTLSKNSLRENKIVIGEEDFKLRNPNFAKDTFLQKVTLAFTEIQNAWVNKDLKNVRRYISDSVYQRFNVQFQMMNKLEQIDKINNLKIISTIIDKYEKDGEYDVIHVGIMADISDISTSKKYPFLNEEANERFVEYWSFIRKKGNESHDMYSKNNCPKCGSILGNNMGEVSKCEYCGTITNKGDYDWVLAEITQMSDYLEEKIITLTKTQSQNINKLYEKDKDFSIQHIEDKVSNGYIQICKSLAFNKPEEVKRFVSGELFVTLINSPTNYIYSRFFLNYVKLINFEEKDGKDYLTIKLKSSFKRVTDETGELKFLDRIIKSKIEEITLVRDSNAINNGDLYSHSCPNCGGPLEDTTNNECPYCGEALSSTKHDWLITDISYPQSKDALSTSSKIAARAQKFIKSDNSVPVNFGINEIILNNVIILMFADKELHRKEEEFIYNIGIDFGFSKDVIESLILLGKQDRLSLKFPSTKVEKTKMLAFMKRAFSVDGKVIPEEESLFRELEELIIV